MKLETKTKWVAALRSGADVIDYFGEVDLSA